MKINFINGDATEPKTSGKNIIVHICNNVGAWGAGFVLALNKKWKEPKKRYREWYISGINFKLGSIQLVEVEKDTYVCNIIGQHRVGIIDGIAPIRYQAVEQGLESLANLLQSWKSETPIHLHMPRIGCGLAGGKWEKIEPIIENTLNKNYLETYVYDFD